MKPSEMFDFPSRATIVRKKCTGSFVLQVFGQTRLQKIARNGGLGETATAKIIVDVVEVHHEKNGKESLTTHNLATN